ncbi:hypothetical protein C8039_18275 [Halogeometricum sp. wsp3]|nr:hypothetical protein C8039_18275 [Halogeometricum sp. wsp3]
MLREMPQVRNSSTRCWNTTARYSSVTSITRRGTGVRLPKLHHERATKRDYIHVTKPLVSTRRVSLSTTMKSRRSPRLHIQRN